MTGYSTTDHLVIGGGPAGSMLAIRLAGAGRKVTLVEREPAAHHKVCGEFLSREATHYLRQIGIDPLTLGAQIIDSVRLSSGNAMAAARLPFQALSLSRRTLDEALLARAGEAGAQMMRGVAVESLTSAGDEWLARLSNGESLRASTIFLATGKHDLRGLARPAGRQNDLVGFKLHWQLAPAQINALRGYMDLYFFPGGYGGLSLIENDVANLCLAVRRSSLRQGVWPQLLAAIVKENTHLRRLLRGAQTLWPRPLAISPIPYGYLAAEQHGPWRIGDQAAVIPSFTGDGISIALHSGALAAEMVLAGESASEFHRTLHRQLRRPMALATFLSRAAVAFPGRTAAMRAVFVIPRAMRWIADATRIPKPAMVGEDAPGIAEGG